MSCPAEVSCGPCGTRRRRRACSRGSLGRHGPSGELPAAAVAASSPSLRHHVCFSWWSGMPYHQYPMGVYGEVLPAKGTSGQDRSPERQAAAHPPGGQVTAQRRSGAPRAVGCGGATPDPSPGSQQPSTCENVADDVWWQLPYRQAYGPRHRPRFPTTGGSPCPLGDRCTDTRRRAGPASPTLRKRRLTSLVRVPVQ